MGSLKSLVLPQQLLQWELWDWRKRHNRLSVLNHIVDVRHSWRWHVSYEVTWLLEIISLLHSKKLLSQSHNDSQERTNSDGGAGVGDFEPVYFRWTRLFFSFPFSLHKFVFRFLTPPLPAHCFANGPSFTVLGYLTWRGLEVQLQ